MNCAIVLGATSMLGQEVVGQLVEHGIEVIKAGRDPASDIVVNLGSGRPPVFRMPHKAQYLFHCASAFGGNSYDGRFENLRVNINGCAETLQIVHQADVRKIIYAGSIFSNPSLTSDPMGGYGFSKAETEQILTWGTHAAGGDFCSLRFAQLWDTEGLCCNHQPWFGRIVAYASRGKLLRMPASNDPRNFMHVSDAARLMISAANSELQGIYPACHPEDVDLYKLAKAACKTFDCGGDVVIDPKKTPLRKVEFPKDSSLYERLGVHPKIALPQGLELIHQAGTAFQFGPLDVQ